MEIRFEEFLRKEHFEENPQLLDDILPDAFDEWIGNLSIDEWLIYGERFAIYFARKELDIIFKT